MENEGDYTGYLPAFACKASLIYLETIAMYSSRLVVHHWDAHYTAPSFSPTPPYPPPYLSIWSDPLRNRSNCLLICWVYLPPSPLPLPHHSPHPSPPPPTVNSKKRLLSSEEKQVALKFRFIVRCGSFHMPIFKLHVPRTLEKWCDRLWEAWSLLSVFSSRVTGRYVSHTQDRCCIHYVQKIPDHLS